MIDGSYCHRLVRIPLKKDDDGVGWLAEIVCIYIIWKIITMVLPFFLAVKHIWVSCQSVAGNDVYPRFHVMRSPRTAQSVRFGLPWYTLL